MDNKRWGPGSEVRFDVAQPIGQVIEYSPAGYSAPLPLSTPTAAPSPRPGAGELLKIALAVSGCVLLGVWLTTWGSKAADFIEAFRLACVVSGAVLIMIWLALIALYLAADLGRSFDHLLLATIKAREIAADREVRLAEINMRRAVSLAQARLDAGRAETARAALAQTTSIPSALTDRDQTEEAIVQAVISAYKIAGPDGTLDGSRQCPFGKRAVGDKVYPVLLERLANPGTRWGIHGCASIANYDAETKRWTVNLREYPTPDRAVAALCGR